MSQSTLDEIAQEAGTLAATLPLIAKAPGVNLDCKNDARFRVLLQSAAALAARGQPVVTLFGPTGSGKSTLFTLLTGIEVPSGEGRRPCTCQCLVAVPETNAPDAVQRLFPGANLRKLKKADELRDESLPPGTVFWTTYRPDNTTTDVIIADVPDINSVKQPNWERATQMAERAEVVIFVATCETYVEKLVVRHLAHVCRLAGHLAYVLTKATKAQAEEIWPDLCNEKIHHYRDMGDDATASGRPFAATRADGLTLSEFLKRADVYYSPRSDAPTLDGVVPLNENTPQLAQFLHGRDIAQITFRKHRNSLEQGLAFAREALDRHKETLEKTSSAISRESSVFGDEGIDLVGDLVSVSEILSKVIDAARDEFPWYKKIASTIASFIGQPIRWLGRSLLKGAKEIVLWFSKATAKEKAELQRDGVESKLLRAEAEKMIDRWRQEFNGVIPLSAQVCDNALREFENVPVPAPERKWDDFVKSKAREWVRENPTKAWLLHESSAALVAAGTTAFLVFSHVAVTGAVVIKIVGVKCVEGGIGGLLADWLNRLVEEFGMGPLLRECQVEWKGSRNRQLRAHLRRHLADRLVLGPLAARRAAIDAAPAAAAQNHVERLQALLSGLSNPAQ